MIASIFDADEVADDFRDLIAERTEGNPFVVEEMLREAIERGDVYLAGGRWERRAVEEVGIPETVRETILLRIGRLDDEHVDVLRAAAVLGRSFALRRARRARGRGRGGRAARARGGARRAAHRRDRRAEPRYAWRHALTQEAVYTDTVRPRRQRLHERAAAALVRRGSAGRSRSRATCSAPGRPSGPCRPASPRPTRPSTRSRSTRRRSCSSACCPTSTSVEHARRCAAIGRLRWLNGDPRVGRAAAAGGRRAARAPGAPAEVPAYRIVLGRAYWETDAPMRALREYELAREELEPLGPSADLAMAYMRISGMHTFAFDVRGRARRGASGRSRSPTRPAPRSSGRGRACSSRSRSSGSASRSAASS